MLLKEINSLKTYLGRAINSATTMAFIEPYIRLAQDEFILPAIGAPMLAELDAQYNSTDPAALSLDNKALLTLLQRSLAFYAYWKYLPFSLGNDGDNGLQEQNTDSSKPVRMGVLEVRMTESISNATIALEQALVYLQDNAVLYPTWMGSPAYTESKSLFLFSATELTMYQPQINNSYRLFLSLRPYIRLVEQNEIRPILGAGTFDALKTALLSPALTGADYRLLDYVKSAVAACAYRDALFNMNVVQTPGMGLRLMSEFDGINNAKAPDTSLLMEAQSRATAKAGKALNSLKTFLEENADAYPAYKTSALFGTKKPNDLPENGQYIGVFRMR